MQIPTFELRESQEYGWVRLTLLGELDAASAPILEDRLEERRRNHQPVLMDLSELEFMDSSGLKIMIECITSASANGWRFAIDPELAPQVRKLFSMTNVDKFLGIRRTDA